MSRSTWASARAASALAFCAGRSGRDLGLNGLLIGNCGRERTLPSRDDILQPFNLPLRHGGSIAALQLALGLQLLDRLLISALRLLDLSVALLQLDLRLLHRGIDLGDPAPSGLQRRFLLRAVELEDRLTRFDLVAEITYISSTRPLDSGSSGTVRKNDTAFVVEG